MLRLPVNVAGESSDDTVEQSGAPPPLVLDAMAAEAGAGRRS
jgi:hypothetical protein